LFEGQFDGELGYLRFIRCFDHDWNVLVAYWQDKFGL
jgi:hypothetical protein